MAMPWQAKDFYRLALGAIGQGMPVVLERVVERDSQGEAVLTVTATVMLEYLVTGENARLRVNQWGGFSYDVFLTDIEAMDTPSVSYNRR